MDKWMTMTPGSKDYGTVNMEVKIDKRNFQVKIYPRLVPFMKSYKSSVQGTVPKSLNSIGNQIKQGGAMLHLLERKTRNRADTLLAPQRRRRAVSY
jgi:uncharacterized protein YvpB